MKYLLFLLLSFQTFAALENIFGEDTRTQNDQKSLPYIRIVKLKIGSYNCSGSFIGKNLVLTASHCVLGAIKNPVPYGDSKKPIASQLSTSLEIYVQYKDSKFSDYAKVISAYLGTTDIRNEYFKDVAVVKINKDLGTKYGYFDYEVSKDPLPIDAKDLTLGAYDFWTYAHDMHGYPYLVLNFYARTGCSIKSNIEDGAIYHDCDSEIGSSGAPILRCSDTCKIIAVNTGEFRNGGSSSLHLDQYSDEFANVGVRMNLVAELIETLKKSP